MYQLILMIHVVIAIAIIGLVLIQHGKGADIGAAFGSGASNTVFGSQGTGSFLFKLTGGLAIAFFITSVSLSTMISNQPHYEKLTEQNLINSGRRRSSLFRNNSNSTLGSLSSSTVSEEEDRKGRRNAVFMKRN